MKVRAPRIEGATRERLVLDDTAGPDGKHIRITANNAAIEVDGTHPRVRELLRKGDLVEVKSAEAKADAK